MKALTLTQPWATLIAKGHKDIENRSWRPPASLIGRQIAIHASRRLDDGDYYAVQRDFGLRFSKDAFPLSSIIAVATIETIMTSSDDPWFCGPFGWLFSEVKEVGPIPHKGERGLWNISRLAQEKISNQLVMG